MTIAPDIPSKCLAMALTVRMSVVPKQTRRMIARNAYFIVQDLTRFGHHVEHVVLRSVRRNGEAVKVQVRHIHASLKANASLPFTFTACSESLVTWCLDRTSGASGNKAFCATDADRLRTVRMTSNKDVFFTTWLRMQDSFKS